MKIITDINELKILVSEVIEWHDTAILKQGKLRELANKLIEEYNIPSYESLRVAESLVNSSCLRYLIKVKI